MTSGTSVAGEPGSLHQGAGLPRAGIALRPGLVYDLPRSAWRTALLTGRFDRLNLPSVLVTGRAPVTVQRRVTNVGSRSMYYSAARWGFTSHKLVMMICLRCGFVHQFSAGRGIWDFD